MKTVLAITFLLIGLITPLAIYAQALDPIGTIGTPPGIDNSPDAVNNYVGTIMNTAFFIGLIATLLYMLYGGIRWIMSGGDQKALTAARETIVQAIIGLILLSTAYAIATVLNIFIGGGSGGPSRQPITNYRDINGRPTDVLDLRRCGSNVAGSPVNEQVKCEEPFSGGSMNIDVYNSLPESERERYCVAPVARTTTRVGGCTSACERNHSLGEYRFCQPYP
jgi:hypothetical protein